MAMIRSLSGDTDIFVVVVSTEFSWITAVENQGIF
jgi:hypothetical protein